MTDGITRLKLAYAPGGEPCEIERDSLIVGGDVFREEDSCRGHPMQRPRFRGRNFQFLRRVLLADCHLPFLSIFVTLSAVVGSRTASFSRILCVCAFPEASTSSWQMFRNWHDVKFLSFRDLQSGGGISPFSSKS